MTHYFLMVFSGTILLDSRIAAIPSITCRTITFSSVLLCCVWSWQFHSLWTSAQNVPLMFLIFWEHSRYHSSFFQVSKVRSLAILHYLWLIFGPFSRNEGKKIVNNTTKHNKAKLMRKLWFYRLLMVSLLCGSQEEAVVTWKHS